MPTDDSQVKDEWSFSERPTRIVVDLDIIANNAKAICAAVGRSVRVMGVVKANGYGHGAVRCARAAAAGGVTDFGVATLSEGIELRDEGLKRPILVLGPTEQSEIDRALDHDVALTIGSCQQLESFVSFMGNRSQTRRLAIHLKFDTGMNRYGLEAADALSVLATLAREPTLELSGVFTHFAEADECSLEMTERQAKRFKRVLGEVKKFGFKNVVRHAANSSALLRSREFDFDMVRAGICLYGIEPSQNAPLFPGMRAALTWQARLQRVATLSPGERIGYGGTYVTNGQERIGLVPVGYADGYPRHLSNTGWVSRNGVRMQVLGRVSMDQFVVRLPDQHTAEVGDIVTLIGDENDGAPGTAILAELAETIPYEIVARLSPRVPVCYKQSGRMVAVNNRVIQSNQDQ